MTQSMTGMGRARGKLGGNYLSVEVKSINHRFCEVNTRLPTRYQSFEILITKEIKKRIKRGKVDVWVGLERNEAELNVDEKALQNYFQFLKKIKSELKLKEDIGITHIQNGASNWMQRSQDAEKDWPVVKSLLDKALKDVVSMRAKEGKSLKVHINKHVQKLLTIHQSIYAKRKKFVSSHQAKIQKRIDALLDQVDLDKARLANEVAYLVDRTDITEELERLVSHFNQMKKLLAKKEAIGRPLDFLIQEMNREWNTIASKSQDVSISHLIVSAKSELEKIREQIQNIE